MIFSWRKMSSIGDAFSYSVSLAAFLISCIINTGCEDPVLDCKSICANLAQCSPQYNCDYNCEKADESGKYQNAFIEAAKKCATGSCGDFGWICMGPSMSSCERPSMEGFYQTLCEKTVPCGFDTPYKTTDECVSVVSQEYQGYNGYNCLTETVIEGMIECEKTMSCSDSYMKFYECMVARFGTFPGSAF